MQLSINEYKILKKLYRKSSPLEDSPELKRLPDNNLIYSEITGMDEVQTTYSNTWQITVEGKVAYEKYRQDTHGIRMTSLRSWIAIIISAIALAVSIIDKFL